MLYLLDTADGGVISPGCDWPNEPSKSSWSSFGVDRREVGVKGSYEEEADEKLVPVEVHGMAWLPKPKLSSMSNLKSESNCIVAMLE
jgi:hypothetical protein